MEGETMTLRLSVKVVGPAAAAGVCGCCGDMTIRHELQWQDADLGRVCRDCASALIQAEIELAVSDKKTTSTPEKP